jgi:putative peptidoglycan lipid II flippase
MPPTAATEAPATSPTKRQERTGAHSLLVSAGIFLSRISGLIRQRVLAHYLGLSDAADAFNAAFKIPNLLQNLFGEGVLSASFIPVYKRLLAHGDHAERRKLAGAVAAILALTVAVLVLAGVLATPWLIDAIAPGFHGEKRELTVRLVRVLFPATGVLVLSAWCLGVLNSHERFFLPYAAPVAWNLVVIATLLFFGPRLSFYPLAVATAWGAVAGAAVQLLVQLPAVLRLLGGLRPAIDTASPHVRQVVRNFGPVFVSRGVVQLSGYIDVLLASLLPVGAVTALSNAQTLTMLPVSLFGMAVSAAELVAMSGAVGDDDAMHEALRKRVNTGMKRIAFFVVPSAVAFLALGDVLAGALFQTGRFRHSDSIYVWSILAGSSVGLLATTVSRLYTSSFNARHRNEIPLRYAIVRVALTTLLGYLFAIPLPAALGLDPKWGAAGLTASAGLAGWVEFVLLRRAFDRETHGRSGLSAGYQAKLWSSAALAAAVAWAVKWAVQHAIGAHHPVLLAAATLLPYGLVYLATTRALGIEGATEVLTKVARRLGRRRRPIG